MVSKVDAYIIHSTVRQANLVLLGKKVCGFDVSMNTYKLMKVFQLIQYTKQSPQNNTNHQICCHGFSGQYNWTQLQNQDFRKAVRGVGNC